METVTEQTLTCNKFVNSEDGADSGERTMAATESKGQLSDTREVRRLSSNSLEDNELNASEICPSIPEMPLMGQIPTRTHCQSVQLHILVLPYHSKSPSEMDD